MAYKRIRVWDGSTWQQVGSQVPGILDASGNGSVTLSSGVGTIGLAYGDITFSFTPQVFVQVTGTNHATITVEADTVGFTVNAKGTGTDTITFDWFAVQSQIA